MLSTKQQTVFKWLKDILQLPVYANVYKGALELLDNKPSGYITFVSHAGRDLINCLAATTIGAERSRDEYKNNLDKLKKRWKKKWGAEDTEEGHLIPSATCKLVQKLIDDDEAGHLRASELVDLFFDTFLDYADREKISQNLFQKSEDARIWFQAYAHVREPDFRDNTPSEVERHFRTLDELLYAAACSQFGRIKILDGILNSKKKPKGGLIVDRALELVKNKFDRQYFFTRLKNPHWIQLLADRRCFQFPPRAMHFEDGSVQFPMWPELRYLENVSSGAPERAIEQIIEILLALPSVDNPRIYSEILEIALQLPGNYSAKLEPRILEYTNLEHHFLAHRFADVLAYWTGEKQTDAALTLTKTLVEFVPDPQDKSKRKHREEEPIDLEALLAMLADTRLEPLPRFGSMEYRRILSTGVRPLAVKEPYKVACILIDATANMIRLRTHRKDLGKDFDDSKLWFQRLTESEGYYENAETSLVHTLTCACQQVYEKSPDSVEDLDGTLRAQPWRIFKRLRHHLFAQYPTETTKPWIRELIREYEKYGRWEYGYEFQQMIRGACEHFGTALLTKDELKSIFDCIRDGHSKDDRSEEEFRQNQRRFHRKQFRPFAPVLFDEYKTYFQELEAEAEGYISDDDYPPFKTRGGHVSTHSPRSPEDLAYLTDEELLSFINKWDEKDRIFEGNHFIETNVQGLSGAFRTVFKEQILPDPERHSFWMENRDRIERPVFVERIINAMQECVEENNFAYLDEWLAFSEWVLSQPDNIEHGILEEHAGESQDNPIWTNCRYAVSDFLISCFRKDVDLPISTRAQFVKILDMLCTQRDWYLDSYLRGNELIDQSMNTPRCRALEALVNFGLWLRRSDATIDVPEIAAILEKRFAPEAEHPLALPEYDILGENYERLLYLNKAWTIAHKSDLFPQSDSSKWLAAFDGFLIHNGPSKPTFESLRDDYVFALQNLKQIKKRHIRRDQLILFLGKHLFFLYLWDEYPLTGNQSLLEEYYKVTADDPEHWASLFEDVGRTLWESNEQLDTSRRNKIIEFFNWRLVAKESKELREITFWLKVKCFDARWRLSAYLKVLDTCKAENMEVAIQINALCDMLPDYTAEVVACFAKLTDGIRDDTIDIYAKGAKTILRAGTESSDENVRKNAVLARENLLRAGRYDLMELDN